MAAHSAPQHVHPAHRQSTAQVIMYDEPTAGLDPVASTVVEDLIRSLRVAREAEASGSSLAGATGGVASYIVVTHQHSTIRRAVDRIVFLHQVRLVAGAAPGGQSQCPRQQCTLTQAKEPLASWEGRLSAARHLSCAAGWQRQ